MDRHGLHGLPTGWVSSISGQISTSELYNIRCDRQQLVSFYPCTGHFMTNQLLDFVFQTWPKFEIHPKTSRNADQEFVKCGLKLAKLVISGHLKKGWHVGHLTWTSFFYDALEGEGNRERERERVRSCFRAGQSVFKRMAQSLTHGSGVQDWQTVPCQELGALMKSVDMTNVHSNHKSKGFAAQTETCETTRMAPITQTEAWFRKCFLFATCDSLRGFKNIVGSVCWARLQLDMLLGWLHGLDREHCWYLVQSLLCGHCARCNFPNWAH